MATRRARIKAVANLPIRRKPEVKTQAGLDLETTTCTPSKLVKSVDIEKPTTPPKDTLITPPKDTSIAPPKDTSIAPPKDTSIAPPKDTSVENTNVCQSENNEIRELEGKASPVKQACELSNNVNNNSVPSTENVKSSMDVIIADNDDSLFNAPASPSKNRPRIRPTPRLGHRRNSIQGSASESEDDGRRSQISFLPNRSRTESSSSFINDTITEPPMSPRKEKFKPRQRSRRTEQSLKLIERKKEFASKYGSTIPDRSKMTVFDMIYYNPSNNPMKQPEKRPRDVTDSKVIQEESVDDPTQGDDEDEEEIAVPQLKVGLNGELVLDEQSLVIETTGTKKGREKLANSDVIYDSDNTSYGIYKKHKRCKDWKPAETIRFYHTLNRLGTDFSMMLALFPERTRRDLRNKYKKEEKINGALIDKAIRNPKTFDIGVLEKQFQAEKEAAEKAENERKNAKKQKKKATYKRNRKIRLSESSEDSQEDSVDNVNNGLLHMAQKADPDVFKKYKVTTKREKIKRDAKKKKLDINVEDLPVEDALVNLKENVDNTNNVEAENGILVLANTAINQTLLQQNGLGMNNIELPEQQINEMGSKQIEYTTQSNAVEQEKMDLCTNEDAVGLFNEVNLTQSCKDLIDLQIQENISNGLSIAEENIFCEDQIDALMSETDNNLSKDYVNEIIIENPEGNCMDEWKIAMANVLETNTYQPNQINVANEIIVENPEGNLMEKYANNFVTKVLETNTCQPNQINVANEIIVENPENNLMENYANFVTNVLETNTCQPNQINVANEIIVENPEGNLIENYANNFVTNVLETNTCQPNQINLANGSTVDISDIPIEIDNIGTYNYNEIIEENGNSHTETTAEDEIAMNDNVESGSYVIKAKPCPIRPSVTIYEVFLKTFEDGKCIFTPIDLTEDELQSCIKHMLPVTE